MNWEEEQEKLTREARLLASNSEAVFEELKKLSAMTRAQRWHFDDKYEVSLVTRNERLINLGLATFGRNQEVLKALYRHGLEPAQDRSDASYKEGLRVGCLSNQTVPEDNFILHFPDDIIGPEETRRVLRESKGSEVTALLQNPKVSDKLLEELYQRKGAFAEMPDERWLHLIYMSASNARLMTQHNSDDMPDMGHYSIHKAIFQLLETAPLKYEWLRALYNLLDRLDFQQVHSPEQIDLVLSRWAQLPVPKENDSLGEGYWTGLTIKEEFRCFIAALYGRGFANKRTVVLGRSDDTDVALRCAYYGNGDLTVKDMEAAYKRDEGVFTFAAMLNARTHSRRDLRRLMEEEYLGGEISQRWLRYDEQIRKTRPNSIPPVSEELAAEATSQPLDAVRSSLLDLQKGLTALSNRLSELRNLVILGAIILAILIYFRVRY